MTFRTFLRQYQILVRFSAEDDCWIATCATPAFTAMAHGSTPSTAVSDVPWAARALWQEQEQNQ